MGSFTPYCILFVVFLIFSSNLCFYSFALPFCFAVFDCLELEGPNYERIQAALAFAQEIKDFDDLIDPRHLFTYCLGSEPIQYVLEKILREAKSKLSHSCEFPSFLFFNFLLLLLFLVEMAIQYSKEKYAHIRGMKHEPLSQLTLDPKRQKLHDEKGKATVSSPIQIIPSSPTPTIEMTASTPPITHSKGKGKVGKSVWDDPATALGRAHNVITDDELKGLSSVPSHELVSHHIHKLVQVQHIFSHSSSLVLV